MIELERNALVWGIVGNLGGGKTLTAVHIAVSAMRDGCFVVSNVLLNMDLICDSFGEYCRNLYRYVDLTESDPFTWECGDPRGSGGKRRVVVVLDECAEFFDQYSSTKDQVRTFMSWLRHSSKRSQDVILVVQRQEYLAKSVRSLVARWIWVDDLAVWRVPAIKIRLPFCGGLVMQNVFDRQGSRIQSASFLNKCFWGRFYDTAQIISVVNEGATFVYESPPSPQPSFFPVVFYVLSVFALCFDI